MFAKGRWRRNKECNYWQLSWRRAFDPGWLIRRSVSGTAGVIGTRMPRKDTLGAGMSLTSPQDCTAAAVWQADLCQGPVAFFGDSVSKLRGL